MPDYSKCTPDRVTEVREFLAGDQVKEAVRQLARNFEEVRNDSGLSYDSLDLDFGRIGLDVRVTPYMAQIIVHDPTPEIMDEVARSHWSFCRA